MDAAKRKGKKGRSRSVKARAQQSLLLPSLPLELLESKNGVDSLAPKILQILYRIHHATLWQYTIVGGEKSPTLVLAVAPKPFGKHGSLSSVEERSSVEPYDERRRGLG